MSLFSFNANSPDDFKASSSRPWTFVSYALFDSTQQLFESLTLEWMQFANQAQTLDKAYSKLWWQDLIKLQSLYATNRNKALPGQPVTNLLYELLAYFKTELRVFEATQLEEDSLPLKDNAAFSLRLNGLAFLHRRALESQVYLEPCIDAEDAYTDFEAWQQQWASYRTVWQQEQWKALRSLVFYYTLQQQWPNACRIMAKLLDSVSQCDAFNLPEEGNSALDGWTQELFICLPPLAEGLVHAGELDALWQLVSGLDLLMHRTERWSNKPTHPLQVCHTRLKVSLLNLLVRTQAKTTLVQRLVEGLTSHLEPLAPDYLNAARSLLQVYKLASQAVAVGFELPWHGKWHWCEQTLHVLKHWQWDQEVSESALSFLSMVLTDVNLAEHPEGVALLVEGLFPLLLTHSNNTHLLSLWSNWLEACLRWVGYQQNIGLLLQLNDKLARLLQQHGEQAPRGWSVAQAYVCSCLYSLKELPYKEGQHTASFFKPDESNHASKSLQQMSTHWLGKASKMSASWSYSLSNPLKRSKNPIPVKVQKTELVTKTAYAWQGVWNSWSLEQRAQALKERVKEALERQQTSQLEVTGVWAELLMQDCLTGKPFKGCRLAWTQLYQLWLEHPRDARITRALLGVAASSVVQYGWESYPTQRAEALLVVLGQQPENLSVWKGLVFQLRSLMEHQEMAPFVEALQRKVESMEVTLPEILRSEVLLIKSLITHNQLQHSLQAGQWHKADEQMSELRWLWLSLPNTTSTTAETLSEVAAKGCLSVLAKATELNWQHGFPDLEAEWLQDLYELYPKNPVIALAASKGLLQRLVALLSGETVPSMHNLLGAIERQILPWIALESSHSQAFAEVLALAWGSHLRALLAQNETKLATRVLGRCMALASQYDDAWPAMAFPLASALVACHSLDKKVLQPLLQKAELLFTSLQSLELDNHQGVAYIEQSRYLLHLGYQLETGKVIPQGLQGLWLGPVQAVLQEVSCLQNPTVFFQRFQWQALQQQLNPLFRSLKGSAVAQRYSIEQRLDLLHLCQQEAPLLTLCFDLLKQQWQFAKAYDATELRLQSEADVLEEVIHWPFSLSSSSQQVFWLLGQQAARLNASKQPKSVEKANKQEPLPKGKPG